MPTAPNFCHSSILMCLLWSSCKITHCFDLTNGNMWALPAAAQLVYGCLHHWSEMMLLHGRMGHVKLYADLLYVWPFHSSDRQGFSSSLRVESVFCLFSQIFRAPHWISAFTNLLPYKSLFCLPLVGLPSHASLLSLSDQAHCYLRMWISVECFAQGSEPFNSETWETLC